MNPRAYDAWTVVGDEPEPEPWGSHATLDAALRSLDGRGGAVTAGMTFLRWHDATQHYAREVLTPALKQHGFRAAPPWRDTPW